MPPVTPVLPKGTFFHPLLHVQSLPNGTVGVPCLHKLTEHSQVLFPAAQPEGVDQKGLQRQEPVELVHVCLALHSGLQSVSWHLLPPLPVSQTQLAVAGCTP
jgi:hypothetical protein